mgnify:CR=1 FL=1
MWPHYCGKVQNVQKTMKVIYVLFGATSSFLRFSFLFLFWFSYSPCWQASKLLISSLRFKAWLSHFLWYMLHDFRNLLDATMESRGWMRDFLVFTKQPYRKRKSLCNHCILVLVAQECFMTTLAQFATNSK